MNRVFYSLRKTSYSTVKVRNNKTKSNAVIKRKMHSSSPNQDPDPFLHNTIIVSAVATYLILKTHESQKK
jgi:hypothetical protein